MHINFWAAKGTHGSIHQNFGVVVPVPPTCNTHIQSTVQLPVGTSAELSHIRKPSLLAVIIIIIIIIIITKELIRVTQSQLYNCYWDTVQTHYHWSGKDCRKSVCLSFCRNVASDGAALTENGRAFHVRAADTGNALSPSVEQRVAGTISFMDSTERRRRRACTSRTGCSYMLLVITAVDQSLHRG